MKPHFHKVPVNSQTSFSIRHDVKPSRGSQWHYHPELELHHVIRGEGVRFIGDNISNFSSGEILLLGENLPHTWRCNEAYDQEPPDRHWEALLMQFRPDCLGQDFLRLAEAHPIQKLYERAQKGLLIKGKTSETIIRLMHSALEAGPLQRLSILLSVLGVLVESSELETITSAHTFYQSNEVETVRLNNVYSYTLANYTKEITLPEIASIANLSVTSFCRYFKQITHKTYHDFLTEVRISHVCRALIENKLPIDVISSEGGFTNLSNFYRRFKRIKGMTPLTYRQTYHQ